MYKSCLFFLLVTYTTAQTVFNCPQNWYQHGQYCYLFEGDFPASYDQARLACSNHGSALLSVEDTETHSFIKNWLDASDPFLREWYTSGIRERVSSIQEIGHFIWKGSGSQLGPGLNFWNDAAGSNSSDGVIVYGVGGTGYGWTLVSSDKKLPYICQVAIIEAYRIVQDDRDYDYGETMDDFNILERGPRFIQQPFSIVVVGTPEMAELECIADANPPPLYRWYRGSGFKEEMTSALDSRYTITNGKLTIQHPREIPDANMYRCTAQNKIGLVISNDVQLSFGRLGEFSNVPDAAVNARAYDGVAIDCSKINYKPAVWYNWFKDTTSTFVRPQFQTYQFISQNGKLYFSEVTRMDEGQYHCMAVLTGVNRHTIGTSQPPTRTSLPIQLHVHDQAPKADWGPEIQDDFIAVFPQPPLKGQAVRLECFAYGSSNTPFQYNWRREEKPLPERTTFSDHNRVLTIPDAALEDQGTYTCTVSRGSSNVRATKSVYLSLGARPYFISPLRNQHVDVSSQLTWRCDSRANPPATYSWYKNGELLTSNPDKSIQVNRNVLRISNITQLHNGMYQCGAINNHGMSLSEAQLRVLAFSPTFRKNPIKPKITVSLQGNATLSCKPQGAPAPVITWFKDGVLLTGDGSHIMQLSNGNLVLHSIQTSDQGRYTCKAENQFGTAQSSTKLTTASGTFIIVGPINTQVSVNSTAFLTCVASFDPLMDLVYTWYFNGKRLLMDQRSDLRQVTKGPAGFSGLYIINVNFFHAGYYECVARTTLNEDKKGAWLTVVGPPSEPTGCMVDTKSIRPGSVDVLWTPGADNGRPISLFSVEMANSFQEGKWTTVFSDNPGNIAISEKDNQKRRVTINDDLSPGNGYRFRVRAFNHFGPSVPSLPTIWIHMPSAPPSVAPHDVSGGGGSVGELTITWTPLELYEEGGANIGYRVYWRKHGLTNGLWRMHELHGYNDHHVTFVDEENFFLEYEVKVQAFNGMGYGPNSSVQIVFSAEHLPAVAVTDVRGEGYNGTANQVTWTEVPSTREMARGIILGYQINHWLETNTVSTWKEFTRVEGHVNEGIFIGLESDTNYIVEVRAYNSAGLGPPSETYLIESKHAPAAHYPEEVRVYSADHGQVMVWWRGIHISQPEANVNGFVLYFWPANEHYRSACEVIVHDHHAHETHVTVDPGILYALRVGAWSDEGGYGKKTPTMYFTLEGEVTIDKTFAKDIDVFLASATVPSLSLLLMLASAMLLVTSVC